MADKGILLAVADQRASGDIARVLGAQWEATSVSTETDALAQLEKRSFHALLVDFNFGSPDGSDLLNHALEKRPETLRFLLAYEADLALVAAKVVGSHRILPKPVELDSLKNTIESAMAPLDSIYDQGQTDPASRVGAAPEIPSVHSEVLKALKVPGATAEEVGGIIAQDQALTSELLALTHSASSSAPRNLTDPVEAVEALGFEAVKALVSALRFLAEHSRLRLGYLSLEELWQHSTSVARIARDLVLFETRDRTLASEALAAGLLHDLGKVVLAINFDDLYGRVHSLARKQPVALWDIEREMFGATHGEITGCLVGMWDLPASIVEAAAFHHEPTRVEHQQFTPLAAVHIADALEHGLRPADDRFLSPAVDTALLSQLGLLQRLPIWRAAVANWALGKPKPELESAETDQPEGLSVALSAEPPTSSAALLSGPTRSIQPITSGQRALRSRRAQACSTRHQRTHWVSAGAAAVCLLALWLATELKPDPPVLVRARTLTPPDVTAVALASPPRHTAPEPEPEVTPAPPVSQPHETASAATAASPAQEISVPEPEPTSAVASQAIATNVPSPSLAAREPAAPEFRLNGIICTTARPSAIVNGQTVFVGDRLKGGATVIAIGRTGVTVDINGQRTTCDLPKPSLPPRQTPRPPAPAPRLSRPPVPQ